MVVVGSGPIGLLTADCAYAPGAGHVIVTGSGQRLDKAREMGFDVVSDREQDPRRRSQEAHAGQGRARDGGHRWNRREHPAGRVAFTGVLVDPVQLPMQRIVLEEIDLYGVCANRNTMDEVLPLIARCRVRVKPPVTHTFPLDR